MHVSWHNQSFPRTKCACQGKAKCSEASRSIEAMWIQVRVGTQKYLNNKRSALLGLYLALLMSKILFMLCLGFLHLYKPATMDISLAMHLNDI